MSPERPHRSPPGFGYPEEHSHYGEISYLMTKKANDGTVPSLDRNMPSHDAESSTFTPHRTIPNTGSVQKLPSRPRRGDSILEATKDESRIAMIGRVDVTVT